MLKWTGHKLLTPPTYTKNYKERLEWKSLSQGRAQQLIIGFQMVMTEGIHTINIVQTEHVLFGNIYVHTYACDSV